MTVGVKSVPKSEAPTDSESEAHTDSESDDENVKVHTELLDYLRKRGRTFDERCSTRLGEREDSLRKALYIGAHWCYATEYYKTGRKNPLYPKFTCSLFKQTAEDFAAMMTSVHEAYLRDYRLGLIGDSQLQFAYELFHQKTGSTICEMYKIIYKSYPPNFV